MAVVTKYAGSAKDPSVAALVPPALAEGRMRAINVPAIAITNGDSINSAFYLGKISSAAVPFCGASTFKHGAVTSVNDADIGVYKDGAIVDIDLFADGLDISSAGAKDPFAAVAVANVGKTVWQLLGLANDPGVEYDVVLTLKVAATATASVGGSILYSKK